MKDSYFQTLETYLKFKIQIGLNIYKFEFGYLNSLLQHINFKYVMYT